MRLDLCGPYNIIKNRLNSKKAQKSRLELQTFDSNKAKKASLNEDISFWSGMRESNPRLSLGKAAYYHCTNTAFFIEPDYYSIIGELSQLIPQAGE